MREISHVRHSVWFWLRDTDYFASRLDDILFIGLQETLNRDFEALLAILGLAADVRLPTGDVESHKNPAGLEIALSERATHNLRDHYSADIQFYSLISGALDAMRKCEGNLASGGTGPQSWNLRFQSAWAAQSRTTGIQEP
jgi:hypothetical protein